MHMYKSCRTRLFSCVEKLVETESSDTEHMTSLRLNNYRFRTVQTNIMCILGERYEMDLGFSPADVDRPIFDLDLGGGGVVALLLVRAERERDRRQKAGRHHNLCHPCRVSGHLHRVVVPVALLKILG